VIALPHSYAGVAPEWLTAVLSTSYPDVQVTSVNIVDEIYGAAAKARLELTYAGPDYGLPATMMAKTVFAEPKATTRSCRTGTRLSTWSGRFASPRSPSPAPAPRSFCWRI
jgi:hypothetical protein